MFKTPLRTTKLGTTTLDKYLHESTLEREGRDEDNISSRLTPRILFNKQVFAKFLPYTKVQC